MWYCLWIRCSFCWQKPSSDRRENCCRPPFCRPHHEVRGPKAGKTKRAAAPSLGMLSNRGGATSSTTRTTGSCRLPFLHLLKRSQFSRLSLLCQAKRHWGPLTVAHHRQTVDGGRSKKIRRYITEGNAALTKALTGLLLETFHRKQRHQGRRASPLLFKFGNVSTTTLRDTVTCLRTATEGRCPHTLHGGELRRTADSGKGTRHG